MKIAPEKLLGLADQGYGRGFYKENWLRSVVDLDMFLYRLRVLALSSWREKSSPLWRVCKNAPVRRYEAPSAVVDGKLAVIGGFSGTEIQALTRTDVYDPVGDSWSSGTPLYKPLTHVVPAVVDGRLWVAGGFAGDHPGPTIDWTASLDVAAGNWRDETPLPQKTASAGLVVLGRNLHCIGGYLDRDATTGAHWSLSLDEPDRWVERAPMRHPRGHHATAVVGGRIYAIGGQLRHDTNPVDLDVVEVYDPNTDRWDECASLPEARSHTETGVIERNGRLVVLGGLNRGGRFRIRGLPDVSSYDPERDAWTDVAPLPVGLIGLTARVIGDEVIVTGGLDLLRPGASQAGTIRAPATVLDPPE